jgi:phage protein D
VFMEGPPRTMRITGLAAEVRSLMKTPTVKEFDGKTVKEIVEEVAKDRGISGAHVDEEIGKIKVPYLNQTVSNYHLLTEIERRVGGILSFTPQGIVLRKRDGGTSVSEREMPTLVLRPEHLNSWSTRITERYNYSHVEAAWFNKDTLKREWEKTDLFTTLTENKFPIGRMFNSKEEAKAAADAKANSFRRGKIQGNFILAKGDPWITAQMPVVVQEMRDGINGRYVVDKVTHTYLKDQGISTTIECNAPGDGNDDSDIANKKFYYPQPGETLGIPLQPGQGRLSGPV